MRFRSVATAAFLALVTSTAGAQAAAATQCSSAALATRDACQQTVDLFNYMAPQLGTSIAGGNPTLGQGGNLGGRTLGLIPKFTVGVRANLIAGGVPTLQTPAVTGINQRTNYPTKTTILGLPAVDAGIGVFKGFPLGVTSVGGVDILLSAAYVPKITTGSVTVTPDSPLKIGYGIRVGLLQEGLVAPGLGISYLKRDLPKTTIVGSIAGSSLTVKDLDLKTTALRFTVSKSLVLFSIALGAGTDTYEAATTIATTTPAGAVTPFPVKQKVTRTNYFGDLSMNLPFIKIVGEGGMVSGGGSDIPTHNQYDKAADASRLYGSVGIRFTF